MGMPRKLKSFDIYQNGIDWVGQVGEIVLPKLTGKNEDWRGAGMNAPVEANLGMEKLEAELTFGGVMYDVYRQWGGKVDGTLLRFAGAYQADDSEDVDAVEVVMRGRYNEIDPGKAKPGDDTEFKVKAALAYYKLIVNGEVLVEIDVLGMIEIINGVDRLAAQRRALGRA